MARETRRWTLEQLIDFEQAVVAAKTVSPSIRSQVANSVQGLDGAAARRAGLLTWLDLSRMQPSLGQRFHTGLLLIGGILGLLLFVSGISAVLGMLDRERGGINVPLFLALLIGTQWVILCLAFLAWLLRRRTGEGFSALQALAGQLARRFAGDKEVAGDSWWRGLMDGGGAPRAALLWRLARLAQGAGICFNLGILGGLGGLVLIKNVGFFWETTTDDAMRHALTSGVRFLAAPWSFFWPAAAPGPEVIEQTRWLPGRSSHLAPGPAAWWMFLLLTTLFWGLLPRLLLWLLAWHAQQRALAAMDFQGRHHRALWRQLHGAERVDTEEKPLDGVLVLDVGGSGLSHEALRPYLLRRLRVHPASWHTTAVLDPASESAANAALAEAPAGVVLLAEGWSLSPPRMASLHAQIRALSGSQTPIKFLIANGNGEGQPVPADPAERREWERFVDSLRDPAAEVFFFA